MDGISFLFFFFLFFCFFLLPFFFRCPLFSFFFPLFLYRVNYHLFKKKWATSLRKLVCFIFTKYIQKQNLTIQDSKCKLLHSHWQSLRWKYRSECIVMLKIVYVKTRRKITLNLYGDFSFLSLDTEHRLSIIIECFNFLKYIWMIWGRHKLVN